MHKKGSLSREKTRYLISIAGPTAAGKTQAGIRLAQQLQCEIVSADSRQFYKEMQIGTAVPSAEELTLIPHHFIHSHSIFNELNVGSYEREALQTLEKLFEKYHTAILLGGSGLYLKAITEGLDELPGRDEHIRELLTKRLAEEGPDSLVKQLEELDPLYARQIDRANPHRLIRALEVCLVTGRPYSGLRKAKPAERFFKTIKVGIDLPRPALYSRIDARVDRMMEQGLLEEAEQLFPYRNLNALQTVGYTELFDYLEGTISLEKAVELIKQHTRQFAKRQLTWFRRDPDIRWFLPEEQEEINLYIDSRLQNNL